MLARTPKTAIYLSRPAEKPKRLSKDRKRSIREKIIAIMRTAEPTPFAAEGPCRAGIRSSLCLEGWKWAEADAVAHEIVTAALNIVGAKRPNWYEGQPEWTQPGALPVHRDRCKRCRGPIPEGRRIFCCRECKQWHHAERGHQAREEAIRAYQKAWYAAWKEKQPKQACECCGEMFRPTLNGQRFCSVRCVNLIYQAAPKK